MQWPSDAGGPVSHSPSAPPEQKTSYGYTQKFGPNWVNFSSEARTIKNSGNWYAQVAQSNTLTI